MCHNICYLLYMLLFGASEHISISLDCMHPPVRSYSTDSEQQPAMHEHASYHHALDDTSHTSCRQSPASASANQPCLTHRLHPRHHQAIQE